jgi:hypothetical protein
MSGAVAGRSITDAGDSSILNRRDIIEIYENQIRKTTFEDVLLDMQVQHLHPNYPSYLVQVLIHTKTYIQKN